MLFISLFSFRRHSYGKEKQGDLERKRKEVVMFFHSCFICAVYIE